MELSKEHILLLFNKLDDAIIYKIYEAHKDEINDDNNLKKNIDIKQIEEQELENKIDKDSTKYKIALKFINNLLKNIGKKEINDLTEFKNINREDIIRPINVTMLENMMDVILKYYGKNEIGWYRKEIVKNYILAFIRCICRELNFKFTVKKRNKQTNCHIKLQNLYSIIK